MKPTNQIELNPRIASRRRLSTRTAIASLALATAANELTPKWSTKLAGYDVYIWDQCYAMEQSLRIDEQ